MGTCPDAVKRLIDRFNQQADQVRSADYNETQLRIDFINPMFAQLGWDMDNTAGNAEQYREVVHEDRVKVAGVTKAPDYSFRIGGVRKFFLEAKKPFVNIKKAWEPAYQLRRYAWSAKLAVSLLTDFEELAIYDCRIAPRQLEKPAVARREFIAYTDYAERWDFIEGTFSKRAVLTGEFDRYCATRKGRGAQEFDEAFLVEIEDWRKKLASNLALRNETITQHDLNFATQRIIDRIIFLRICEDRGVEPVGHLQQLLSGDNTYQRLVRLFHEADARYNSGLFHFRKEAGRDEAPDELTTTLEVDDDKLKSILKRLYYPESPYEFAVVSADILGSVYERFLGSVIELTPGHRVRIEPKPEVRKAGGVYYTPTYIVDYIVKHTVGRLLGTADDADGADLKTKSGNSSAKSAQSAVTRSLSPKEAAKLKILDPACGSGSFLLGAYQYLLDWHLKWYVSDGPEKHSKGKNATIRPADKPNFAAPPPGAGALLPPLPTGEGRGEGASADQVRQLGHWALTTRERKRILLDNIHGVDIDYQAVEVTKLSLLLRCLEGETAESLRGFMTLFRERALPDLGRNIQCGNSLIGTDIMHSPSPSGRGRGEGATATRKLTEDEITRINPFDYERAFPQVFSRSSSPGTHSTPSPGTPGEGRGEGRGEGGFDAVIGNPPYIRMEEFKPLKVYLKERYQAHGERSDLYAYFMERGHRLLNEWGRFGMIVSNKFVRADYGAPLRATLLQLGRPVTITDFAGLPVFEGATVRTLVYVSERNRSPSLTLRYNSPPTPERFEKIRARVTAVYEDATDHSYELPLASLAETGWQFARADVTELMEKLTRERKTLAEMVDRQIWMGVKSGLMEAFVVDSETRSRLIRENPEAAEILKPLLNGRDVRRYHLEHEDRCLIYTHHGINMRRYPAVLAHLRPFRQKLERRATQQEWYELQQPQLRFAPFMEKPKLVFPDIATEPRFMLDEQGFFGTNTVYFIPRADRFLLALLNSRVAFLFFREVCAGLEGGGEVYLRFFGQYLERFPVAQGDAKEQRRLGEFADSMLSLHAAESAAAHPQEKEQFRRRIEATDRQIDQLVYELYNLTEDEIAIVEEATKSNVS